MKLPKRDVLGVPRAVTVIACVFLCMHVRVCVYLCEFGEGGTQF